MGKIVKGNNLKTFAALTVALLLSLVVLVGCSNEKPDVTKASETPTLDKIKDRGVLILGTESTYPPFEFIVMKDGKSVGVGMDVDLGQKIADRIGVKFQTSEMAFDSLIPALGAKTIDMAASMTPSEKRKLVVNFSELYYESTNCFIVRKDEVAQYTDKESFKGKTIGAQMGTVQNTLLVEEYKDSKNLIIPKVSTLVQELKNKNIDAICAEEPVADCYVKAHPDLAIASFKVPDEGGGVGFTMDKGTEDLQAIVDEVIKELLASGEMQKIYDRNIELAIEQIVNQ